MDKRYIFELIAGLITSVIALTLILKLLRSLNNGYRSEKKSPFPPDRSAPPPQKSAPPDRSAPPPQKSAPPSRSLPSAPAGEDRPKLPDPWSTSPPTAYGKPPRRKSIPGKKAPFDDDDLESAHLPKKEGLENEKSAPAPKPRFVNIGFSEKDKPESFLSRDMTLATDRYYFFGLEIGDILPNSMGPEQGPFPIKYLPEEAELEVALYVLGGFSIPAETGIGKLKLTGDLVEVAHQPQAFFQIPVSQAILNKRLLFGIQTAEREGTGWLKCNIYCQGILVQSWEIRAEIRAQPQAQASALAYELPYSLSFTLTAEQLNRNPEHKLSVLLSESDQDSHSFQIFGRHQFKNDASFDEGEIANALDEIRGAFRKAAWGTEDELNEEAYRYKGNAKNLNRLATDLFMLAKRGWNLYDALINRLANGDAKQVKKLKDLMREPGYVQLVLQKNARRVLPFSALYDHPLNPGVSSDRYSLCDSFVSALEKNQPLTECACFQGNCPNQEDTLVVCPSGFWGYRHYLGMPHSIKYRPFAPAAIFYDKQPEFMISVWKGDDFKQRESHVGRLRNQSQINWKYADNFASTMKLLKEQELSLVYFYCHGGLSGSYPYLLVGNDDRDKILPSSFRAENIYWENSCPLVFINGCHTTALSPEQALNFVTVLVENSQCAGVIGTEITIFEELAVAFSESFLDRFANGVPVGRAIRDARLDLLKQYNPLGLVYIPFVMSGLQLMRKAHDF